MWQMSLLFQNLLKVCFGLNIILPSGNNEIVSFFNFSTKFKLMVLILLLITQSYVNENGRRDFLKQSQQLTILIFTFYPE